MELHFTHTEIVGLVIPMIADVSSFVQLDCITLIRSAMSIADGT
jgi:hypothetical protein